MAEASTSSPRAHLALTKELSELLKKSFFLCKGRGADVSYTSLLAVMAVSGDTFSVVFRDHSEKALKGIFRQGGFKQEDVERIRDSSEVIIPPEHRLVFGENFNSIWYQAQHFTREIAGRSATDVRDVLASYLTVEGSTKRLSELGVDVAGCCRAFLDQVRKKRPNEFDAWKTVFPPSPSNGATQIHSDTETERGQSNYSNAVTLEDSSLTTGDVGPSTHVAGDRWTIADFLEYRPYAHAIASFLINPKTASPLTISIQAPWGGGKTSMMRMVQNELDPRHPGLNGTEVAQSEVSKAAKTTVGKINKELDGKEVEQTKIELNELPSNGRITVWFNAWKYESTNQIWAGLADAIITQIASRLPVDKKELFYFRLHLKRLDVSKVRSRITNDLVSSLYSNFVRLAWLYVLVSPALGFAAHYWHSAWIHWRSIAAADLIIAAVQFFKTKGAFDKKPATISLADLVAAPNYDESLGFVHHVSEDLRRALELTPDNRSIVIFIDDLDRCSPNKVADVVEAINLFLAGEFEHCMFVLGVDAEIVAAALNKSHGDVFAQMPSYARTSSVGWRFMDKFVQLPFIVPPPDQDQMATYAKSLLLTMASESYANPPAAEQPDGSDTIKVESAASERNRDKKYQETIRKMDENIRSFTDNEEVIANRIVSGILSYSRNPRDVKRFVNSFRFYYFLRSARKASGKAVPSLDQLSRWIVLSLRWPGIIRWLRGRGMISDESAVRDLALLETVAEQSSSLTAWIEAASQAMRLSDKEKAWVSDEDMQSFFAAEAKLPKVERLSASLGKGLW